MADRRIIKIEPVHVDKKETDVWVGDCNVFLDVFDCWRDSRKTQVTYRMKFSPGTLQYMIEQLEDAKQLIYTQLDATFKKPVPLTAIGE